MTLIPWKNAALPALVGLFGLLTLAVMSLVPARGATQVGIVIPPWQQGGIARAANFGMPIIGLRWEGHLIVLDISQNAAALGELQARGAWIITSNLTSCPPSDLNSKKGLENVET